MLTALLYSIYSEQKLYISDIKYKKTLYSSHAYRKRIVELKHLNGTASNKERRQSSAKSTGDPRAR